MKFAHFCNVMTIDMTL